LILADFLKANRIETRVGNNEVQQDSQESKGGSIHALVMNHDTAPPSPEPRFKFLQEVVQAFLRMLFFPGVEICVDLKIRKSWRGKGFCPGAAGDRPESEILESVQGVEAAAVPWRCEKGGKGLAHDGEQTLLSLGQISPLLSWRTAGPEFLFLALRLMIPMQPAVLVPAPLGRVLSGEADELLATDGGEPTGNNG